MTDLALAVENIFSEDGPVSRLTGFEYRPQQHAMAIAISNALEHREHLIVEAPTGVGKTLAYLIPAVLYAVRENRKAIVSTHTKNLQQQLQQNDIPIVQSLIGKDFKAIVLKGRRNYLCTTRLQNALATRNGLFSADQQEELRRIHEWSLHTPDGDIEDLKFTPQPGVWDIICSEKDVCSTSLCGTSCFFQRTKASVRSAHLVIMNHALFFTLSALQGTEERFIFDNDFVVFDEAHTLESVAGLGVGKKLSHHQVLTAIHRLYNKRTKKGLLAKEKSLRTLCANTEKTAREFFETLHLATRSLGAHQSDGATDSPTREVRIRRPHFVANILSGPLTDLHSRILEIMRDMSDEMEKVELTAALRSIWEAQVLIDEFLTQQESRFTYWVEHAGAKGDNVTLCASPSSIAESVGPQLFRSDTSMIMTSATLTVDGTLEYFKHRIGASGVKDLILESPFDFRRQMKLCLVRDIPEPERAGFTSSLPHWIMKSIKQTEGRALVLFTSRTLMLSVAALLSDELAHQGLTLLVQGNAQRHALLQRFKHDVHSVLFGLDSFWMGIDVPGESLEHVIITRLPFAVPNHPLIESRMEAIAQRGGNSFLEYTLPEAVLKLRQGVGRLIRSRTDKGMVTILDSRILKRPYGKIFLSSLPACAVEIISETGETEFVSLEEW